MIGGVNRRELPHLPGVPYLHVNRGPKGKTADENTQHIWTMHSYDVNSPFGTNVNIRPRWWPRFTSFFSVFSKRTSGARLWFPWGSFRSDYDILVF